MKVRELPLTGIRIPLDLKARVAASAVANKRSMNQEFAVLLEQALNSSLAGYERGFNDGLQHREAA